ncbi:unnamed protein product [Amoebophrya sp. A25]|nr:unnamed protein product [Amoebophrya sp. A25]|eukprot:GSA25T00013120001.1
MGRGKKSGSPPPKRGAQNLASAPTRRKESKSSPPDVDTAASVAAGQSSSCAPTVPVDVEASSAQRSKVVMTLSVGDGTRPHVVAKEPDGVKAGDASAGDAKGSRSPTIRPDADGSEAGAQDLQDDEANASRQGSRILERLPPVMRALPDQVHELMPDWQSINLDRARERFEQARESLESLDLGEMKVLTSARERRHH